MFCCDEFTFLGCHTHCGDVCIGDLVATQNGVYTLFIFFEGFQITIHYEEFNIGEPLCFPNSFNESYYHFFKVAGPDGVYITIDDIECFAFVNQPGIESTVKIPV